jgi:hypothetical protein
MSTPLSSARLAGALYLVIIVTGVFSQLVQSSVTVAGDAAATAANLAEDRWLFRAALVAALVLIVSETVMTVVLYHLFRPINAAWSLLAAALRLITLPMYAINLVFSSAALLTSNHTDALFFLDLHDYGYAIALVVFGVQCLVMGRLLAMSGRTTLGVLLGVSGAGYVGRSLLLLVTGDQNTLTSVLLLPALVAESWFCVVLLRGGVAAQTPATAGRASS